MLIKEQMKADLFLLMHKIEEIRADFLNIFIAVSEHDWKNIHCVECKEAFTNKNVFTLDGWKETQISGYCEKCFDDLFNDNTNDNNPSND